jgi:oxygen-independent coproporphyrinogen-3 oxidase
MYICPFCPFNKYLWNRKKEEVYIKALKKEIELYSRYSLVKDRKISAVYFGGGTPTVLSIDGLGEVLDLIKEKFSLFKGVEITVETHPLTTNENKLLRMLEKGINRVSMGVQSFTERLLKILRCPHTKEDGIKAIKIMKEAGLKNIGIDLLYRIPTQKLDEWKRDIETAVRYEVDHISCYSLGVFPGTAFYETIKKGEIPKQPNENIGVKMYKFAKRFLEEHCYKAYTISNFAKSGKECLYNRIVLEPPQGEYIGLGAGAVEYINGYLTMKEKSLERYVEKVEDGLIPYMRGGRLSKREKMAQYLAVGIGCLKISKEGFRKEFGVEIEDVYGETIRKLEKWGLVKEEMDLILLTDKGIEYLTDISKLFLTGVGREIHQGEVIL